MITTEKIMVEVFATNVDTGIAASRLINLLRLRFPGSRVNIDLDDCDRVLRVQGERLCPTQISQLVQAQGFYCGELE
jgi:hypothetical protein